MPYQDPGYAASTAFQEAAMARARLEEQQVETQLAVRRDQREKIRLQLEMEEKEKKKAKDILDSYQPGDIAAPEHLALFKKHGLPYKAEPDISAAAKPFQMPGVTPDTASGVKPGAYLGSPQQQAYGQLMGSLPQDDPRRAAILAEKAGLRSPTGMLAQPRNLQKLSPVDEKSVIVAGGKDLQGNPIQESGEEGAMYVPYRFSTGDMAFERVPKQQMDLFWANPEGDKLYRSTAQGWVPYQGALPKGARILRSQTPPPINYSKETETGETVALPGRMPAPETPRGMVGGAPSSTPGPRQATPQAAPVTPGAGAVPGTPAAPPRTGAVAGRTVTGPGGGGVYGAQGKPLTQEETLSTSSVIAALPPQLGLEVLRGMGISGGRDRREFLRTAEGIRQGKIPPADGQQVRQWIEDTLAYHSKAAALKTSTQLAARADQSYTAFEKNADLAEKTFEKQPNTFSPMLNKMMNDIRRSGFAGASNQADLSEIEVYAYTVVREYAKLAMGSFASVAALTDKATETAEQLLSPNQSPAQFRTKLNALRKEARNLNDSWQGEPDRITKGIGDIANRPGRSPLSDQSGPSKDDPAGILQKKQ